MEAAETATPSSPSPSITSAQSTNRHFYLAVDRIQFKMETLVDLLGMAGRRPSFPIVVCCNTRDELDSVCSNVSNLSYISIAPLYSDLGEAERAKILDKFHHTTMRWNQNATVQSGDDDKAGKEEHKSHMIVATDACLPLLAMGESPLSARVLINYELPTKKETYSRRMATCLAADGIVINMVVGGEVVALKSIEESSSLLIAEMPIDKPRTSIMKETPALTRKPVLEIAMLTCRRRLLHCVNPGGRHVRTALLMAKACQMAEGRKDLWLNKEHSPLQNANKQGECQILQPIPSVERR